MDAVLIAEWLVVFCLGTVVFTYLGYPLFIAVASRLFGRTMVPGQLKSDADLPFISILISAHNEENDIGMRLENLLSLDYPRDRMEFVIASDGSTDDTNEIVQRIADRSNGLIRLLAYEKNRGKAATMTEAVKELSGSLIVLSDANTVMRADAIRQLVSWFDHPEIGAVCGRLVLTDPKTGNNVDSLYWKYETFLKKCESRLGALLGSNGAIYAIRKELFPGLPPNTIIDDFYIPLEAKRRHGCRIVYDSKAVACEETAPSMAAEFGRRVRIGAGGFQTIGLLWPLLLPKHGWVAFAFFCHKVLRWICPFLLIGAFVGNLFLLGRPEGQWLMALQCGGYLLAGIGHFLPVQPKFLRILRLPTMFVSMNAALFLGFFRWLAKKQSGAWTRTARTEEPMAPVVAEREVVA